MAELTSIVGSALLVISLLLAGALFFLWNLVISGVYDISGEPPPPAAPQAQPPTQPIRQRVTFGEFRRRILGYQVGTLHSVLLRREVYGERCFIDSGVQAREPRTGLILEVSKDEWDRALAKSWNRA